LGHCLEEVISGRKPSVGLFQTQPLSRATTGEDPKESADARRSALYLQKKQIG
jgi:hypothetical protein